MDSRVNVGFLSNESDNSRVTVALSRPASFVLSDVYSGAVFLPFPDLIGSELLFIFYLVVLTGAHVPVRYLVQRFLADFPYRSSHRFWYQGTAGYSVLGDIDG
jgi:hypothetical protein